MKKIRIILVAVLIAVGMMGLVGVGSASVLAANETTNRMDSGTVNGTVNRTADNLSCGGVNTSIIGCDDTGESGGGIWWIMKIVVQILTYSVVTLATIGIIISGIQYSTAGDSSEKITQAKKRIFNIIIGVIVYALIALITEFLIPGGVF